MGTAAGLLKELGYQVEGCDYFYYPPMSGYLEQKQIPCHSIEDIGLEELRKFDLIVVGNSLGGKSEQARMIEESGVPLVSAPRILGELLLKDREVLGVCGTHGKTTTTYLMVQILEKLGEKPGYLIGGVLENKPSAFMGEGKYFVIESDEYDTSYFEKFSKFHLYQIDHVFLTSLEFDHGDIFDSIEDIQDEFKRLLEVKKKSLIYCGDYPYTNELLEEYSFPIPRIRTYGECLHSPIILAEGPQGSKFDLCFDDQTYTFETNLVGRHNILNLSACLIWALDQGHTYDVLKSLIKDLKLVKRRQEVRGYYKQALVIDDFAHHPRAVELTLEGIKKNYPEKRVIAIFEAISATARSNLFQAEFTNALKKADVSLIVKPQLATTLKKSQSLETQKMVEELREQNLESYEVECLEDLLMKINDFANSETLFIVMSNRTCLGLWESDFVHELS